VTASLPLAASLDTKGTPEVSRATIARTLVYVGLLAVEPPSSAPPAQEGGAP
jgi:hypothetical protein